MKVVKTRAIISTLLMIDFIIVALTGIGLSQAPSNEIAMKQEWTFFGLPKFKLERLHNRFGLLMIGLVIIHLGINYGMYLNEVKLIRLQKSKQKRQLN